MISQDVVMCSESILLTPLLRQSIMHIRRLSVILASSIVVLMSQFVSANETPTVMCPTADQIKQFSYLASFPFGFNNESKSLKSVIVAANLEEIEAESGWALVMHPLEIGSSETAPQVAQNAIDKLVPVSNTPFNYTIVDDLEISVCAYTLPGYQQVNVLAYYIDQSYDDMDDDNFAKIRSKINHQRMRMLKIARKVNQLIRQ